MIQRRWYLIRPSPRAHGCVAQNALAHRLTGVSLAHSHAGSKPAAPIQSSRAPISPMAEAARLLASASAALGASRQLAVPSSRLPRAVALRERRSFAAAAGGAVMVKASGVVDFAMMFTSFRDIRRQRVIYKKNTSHGEDNSGRCFYLRYVNSVKSKIGESDLICAPCASDMFPERCLIEFGLLRLFLFCPCVPSSTLSLFF
jgi:hypothetical protein